MNNTSKSSAHIFLKNLSEIGKENPFLKLEKSKGAAQLQLKLLERKKFQPENLSSAVFIYFCNVLDSKEFAVGHKDRKPAIIGVADILTIAWALYNSGRIYKIGDVRYQTIEELQVWLDGKLIEIFSYGMDPTLRPSSESLKYIMDDFERISQVSDRLADIK